MKRIKMVLIITVVYYVFSKVPFAEAVSGTQSHAPSPLTIDSVLKLPLASVAKMYPQKRQFF